MKKVLIIGCPGSGKSTFARALAKKTQLPLVHLDLLQWNADRTTVSRDIFMKRLDAALHQNAWIIDGNYQSTLEKRLGHCDTVIYLDYPVDLCLEGVAKRQGKARPDMPWVEEDIDPAFMQFIQAFPDTSRPELESILKDATDVTIHRLTSRDDAQAFLEGLSVTGD